MNKVTHILKHKDLEVSYLWIEEGIILDIKEEKNVEHYPFKYEGDKEKSIRLLNSWIENRGIPFKREDYDFIMDKYKVKKSSELTVLGNGLNLTDHYWLCDIKNEKSWKEVNFYDNNFKGMTGEVLPEIAERYEGFNNPDLSSNGKLKKFWMIENDKRYLYKDGSGDIRQEPFNEYITSKIAELLNIDCLEYKLGKNKDENGKIYSKCICMTDKDNEFINGFIALLDEKNSNDKYNDYIKVCKKNGINNCEEDIDKMIILDYLIRNTDRHLGNFGILRNSESLKWEKIVSLFDNGNSLWHDAQGLQFINSNKNSDCRWLRISNEESVKLTGKRDWLDKSKLNGIDKMIIKVFKLNKNMEEERREKIGKEFMKRVEKLDNILDEREPITFFV